MNLCYEISITIFKLKSNNTKRLWTMQKQKHQYTLKSAQRKAFLQIFNMHAKNGKICKADLLQILQRINFSISAEHFKQICDKAFRQEEFITFQQFMETFKVTQSSFDMIDIRNAFRLIAGDQDVYIPLDRLVDLFKKQNIEPQRIDDLMHILSSYIDQQKRFNYKLFLQHLNN